MKRILMAVAESNFPRVITPDVLAKIEALGEVVKRTDLSPKDPTVYVEVLRAVQPDIVVTSWGSPQLTMDGWRACPALKYLCHCAGTVRGVVDREVIAAGLLVTNWGRTIAPSVAEGALMMTLAALRKVSGYVRLLERGGWQADNFEGEGLFGQKVGLHGFGAIAQEYARLLAPFRCEIWAYSPHCPDDVLARCGVRRETELARLYASNRVVSVHASKTAENFHIVNAAILAGMQDGAVLINTARGAVIDEAALIAELRKGRIWAALDVFEKEPLPADSPLRSLPSCLVMPHVAGPTPDRRQDMGRHALENLTRYVSGQPVTDIVTAEKYDLIT